MKIGINYALDNCQFFRNPNESTNNKTLKFTLLALIAALLLPASPAQAVVNVLADPGFETATGGNVVPLGWTRFDPPTAAHYNGSTNGNYYIQGPAHTGANAYKKWGACYNGTNNVAGIYQDTSCSNGSAFQASGWLFTKSTDILGTDCALWLEVSFLGASSNLLALYKSDNFTAAVGTDTWFQYFVTNACDVSSPVSVGDPYFNTYAVTGSVSQLVAPLGTKTVRYRFAYLQVASEGGSAFFDDAVLNQISGPTPPVISNLSPLNMIFVNPSNGITFNVSSPSGFTINNSNIGLIVNGVDVSGSLAITNVSSANKNVGYHGLQSNLTYTASITVTDAFNFTASASTYFETMWVGIQPVLYLWEAEDFDFTVGPTSGLYFNHPTLCDTPSNPNCYFGTVGNDGVDENFNGTTPPDHHVYRADDLMGFLASGDYSRKDHVDAGVLDYRIDPFNGGEWLNYTRDWSNGLYWVVGRLSVGGGLSGTLTLSQLNPDTSLTALGTFTIASGIDYSTFEYVYLKDTNGNNAVLTLNGNATLQLTSGGNLLPNFFMLVAAQADVPFLSNLYPTGTRPFEYTNTLSFKVTSAGATFATNGITVNLDGNDVSSNLVITGTASIKNVLYPTLMPNAVHVAIITATNSLGHGIRVTNSFDTFSEANYMVEAEDFDYGGGQFIPTWSPDAYADYNGPFTATTNIDFQHISLTGETFPYRAAGIPQGGPLGQNGENDYLRQVFVDAGGQDYVLAFFAGTDWANYTRVYPAGSYYVYGRFSGGGPFSMHLDQVVSGTGTTTQVTRRLGNWSAVGQDYVTYAWVPLTDGGLAAPALVKLNGLSTLRITTDGFCNPNYFMLVPASGITVSAARSGGNVVISFPTQAGAPYRVFHRNDLSTGNWTLLTSVLGDGTVKSVSDPATGGKQFYQVVSP